MQITIEEIQNKFEKLPEDLKWAIMSAKIDEKLMQIGKDQGLNIRQIGQLSLETHAVMLGYITPENFPISIKASLQLPEDKIKNITNSVNETILKGIREKLVEARGGYKEEESDHTIHQEPLPKEPTQIQETIKPNPEKDLENKIKEEDKKITNGIINKKLLSTVASNTTKSEYSANNISKEGDKGEMKKIDPYRMPIE